MIQITNAGIRKLILLVLGVIVLLGGFYSLQGDLQKLSKSENGSFVTIHEKTYAIEIADDENERAIGLSNRQSLAENAGMLFIFEQSDQYGFWMKDTLIPLDIIWISEEKNIVHIEKNVQPGTYPTTYGPDEDALYVLELAAGESEKNFFAEGDAVSISIAE
jgi:uncharacterized membrane protein (UPF0127 family)